MGAPVNSQPVSEEQRLTREVESLRFAVERLQHENLSTRNDLRAQSRALKNAERRLRRMQASVRNLDVSEG